MTNEPELFKLGMKIVCVWPNVVPGSLPHILVEVVAVRSNGNLDVRFARAPDEPEGPTYSDKPSAAFTNPYHPEEHFA